MEYSLNVVRLEEAESNPGQPLGISVIWHSLHPGDMQKLPICSSGTLNMNIFKMPLEDLKSTATISKEKIRMFPPVLSMSFTILCFRVMNYRNFALTSLITEAFGRSRPLPLPKHLMNYQVLNPRASSSLCSESFAP